MATTHVVEVECIACRTKHTILVPTAGYRLWMNRQKRIQDAMPGLSADERELLMSGICGRCFDKIFDDCED